MRPPLHQRLVDKAVAAITAAVEVYNKPAFAYRAETFAILALNGWELLLKAKVVKDEGNDLKARRVYQARPTKSGRPSKKLFLKLNRAGNAQTISLGACIVELEKSPAKLHVEVKNNLEALTEIRDNSVHFVTANALLARQAQELSAAAVQNFVVLTKQWFARDLSRSLHVILPLSFIAPASTAESVVVSADESRLIRHLESLAKVPGNAESPFAVAVRLQLKLEKSTLSAAPKVQVTKDPDAVKVTLTEEDVRAQYPWDYRELCKRMAARYSDFKQDGRFHALRKPLLTDERYAKARYLDPGNPKSPKKDFYNPNVLSVFDASYRRV
ncbi:DUF3644 domain-containing protein [Hydrogenophaga sp. IBVHS1]|uniref:DUF3644 domain-containing protein n=1 Tax=unclassified Hydrogenophaga TaxID=2610897 RepID=UPI000A2E0F31|nr:DUF3644 domain-containing protein [Hydrogenophaga sp. IBVHS1]OSZ74853.1 hypothetical protein CAP37_05205 [Hydrogenophaga sp. IBVHS1]